MKHKLTYIGTALLSLCLCLVLLCGMAPAVLAEGDALPSLDYGIPDSDGNVTVGAVELYEALFGSSPTAAGNRYLSLHGIKLTYNQTIPSNLITTDYNGSEGKLIVTIRPYTYTASNGETVTWIPTHAVIDGEVCEMTEEGGAYVCRLENLYYSQDFDIDVDYRWDVTIPTEAIEHLRNSAYYAGAEGIALRTEHERLLAAWREELAAHEEWNEYVAWSLIQDDYLERLATYNVLKEAFDNYTEEYRAYEDAVELYERWQDFFDYEEYAKLHLEDYNKYATYLKQYNIVKGKLALMDSIYVSDSHYWNMYNSIMGGTVDFVLENEDLLVDKLGYKESFIRTAGDATVALRGILPKYNRLRTAKYESEYERTKALYAFYTENHAALKKNFCDLYGMLKDLFNEYAVKAVLYSEGKLEHYLQFVGQLYVISTCLDEKGDRDPNWTIADQKLEQVVEPCHILPDGDWHPANTSMPEKVDPVEYMEPVTRPEGEQPTRYPTPPMPVVKDPGEPPEAPNDPWNGKYPTEAAHPGNAPAAPVFDQITKNLVAEIDSGKLTLFTGSMEAQSLSFAAHVTRRASFRNYKTVSFYDHEHKLLKSFQVEYGTGVSYKVPDRAPTVQYSYSNGKWISFDGEDFNLSYITNDLALYPTYKRTLQTYLVTWIFEGESYAKLWHYGDIPSPSPEWSLATYEKDHYRYTFSGWDTEVGPVTGDITYRGEMIPTVMEYEVTWVLYGDVQVTERYPALEVPVYTGELSRPADNCRYTFDKWLNYGSVLTGNAVYYANWNIIKLAGGGLGNNELNIEHGEDTVTVEALAHPIVNIGEVMQLAESADKSLTLSWKNGLTATLTPEQLTSFRLIGCTRIILQESNDGRYTAYRFGFADQSGNRIHKIESGVTVEIPVFYDETARPVFFIKVGENYEQVTDTTLFLTEETVIAEAMSYGVVATPDERCNTMTLPLMSMEGDIVSLKLNCVFGFEVTGATVRDAKGNLIPVTEDLTFVMPASPVNITLEIAAIRYTLTFIVDGKIWATQEYGLGDEIVLPETPSKSPAEGYSYTFLGWGEVPALASGDVREMTFTANFSKAMQNVDYTTGEGGSVFLNVVVPIIGIVLLLGIIALIVWRVIVKRRRRRQFLEELRTMQEEEARARAEREAQALLTTDEEKEPAAATQAPESNE